MNDIFRFYFTTNDKENADCQPATKGQKLELLSPISQMWYNFRVSNKQFEKSTNLTALQRKLFILQIWKSRHLSGFEKTANKPKTNMRNLQKSMWKIWNLCQRIKCFWMLLKRGLDQDNFQNVRLFQCWKRDSKDGKSEVLENFVDSRVPAWLEIVNSVLEFYDIKLNK